MAKGLLFGSSRASAPRVVSSFSSVPYPGSMAHRVTDFGVIRWPASPCMTSSLSFCSSVVGAPGFKAGGHPRPNRGVPGDRNPRERGSRPLNTHR